MSSLLPITPYFLNLTRLVFDEVIDFDYTTDGLNRNQQMDFSKPTSSRNHRVLIREEPFYVSIGEISPISPILAELLVSTSNSVDISPNDFKVLLNYICRREEVTVDTIKSLLALAITWKIDAIIADCRKFLSSDRIKKLPVPIMVDIYQLLGEEDEEENDGGKLTRPMRRNILKALLELDDHAELFSLMLTGASSSCFPILKSALKSLKDIQHPISFANCSSPLRCRCITNENGKRLFERKRSRAASPSLCGLYCSECNVNCCVDCQKEMCPVKLDALLESHLSAQKIEEVSPMVGSPSTSPILDEDIALEEYSEKSQCSESTEEWESLSPASNPIVYSQSSSVYPSYSNSPYSQQYCLSTYPQYYQSSSTSCYQPLYNVHSTVYPQSCYPLQSTVYRSYPMSSTISCAYPQMIPPHQYVTQYVHYM